MINNKSPLLLEKSEETHTHTSMQVFREWIICLETVVYHPLVESTNGRDGDFKFNTLDVDLMAMFFYNCIALRMN